MLYNRIFVIVCLFVFFLSRSLFACTLATHNWQPTYSLELKTPSSILPLTELTALFSGDFEFSKNIIWVTEQNTLTTFVACFFPVICSFLKYSKIYNYTANGLEQTLPKNLDTNLSWLCNSKCYLVTPQDDIYSAIKNLTNNGIPPVIVGSVNNQFKIMLYSDANSNYRCHQLVLLNTGKIRLVQTGSKKPTASEIAANAYVSMVFFDYPILGKVLSFSMYPVAGVRSFLIDGATLTAQLLDKKLLLPRAISEMTPDSYNVPGINQ